MEWNSLCQEARLLSVDSNSSTPALEGRNRDPMRPRKFGGDTLETSDTEADIYSHNNNIIISWNPFSLVCACYSQLTIHLLG